MPLLLKKSIPDGIIVLWNISENEAELQRSVTQEDIGSASRFRSNRRRMEHLAWRAALRTVLPDAAITYDEYGAPTVTVCGVDPVKQIHIGVSHSYGMAAVILASGKCAVDVEYAGRDFSRSAPRFVSEKESALAESSHPLFRAAVWCSKETMYKYSGRDKLDFLSDLELCNMDFGGGRFSGRIGNETVEIRCFNIGDHIITYIS